MDKIATGAIFFLTFVAPSPSSQDALTPSISPSKIEAQAKTQTPQFKTYSVETGDTFNSIAKEQYGSSKYWPNLWNDNDWVDNPAQIHNGWELKIRTQKPDTVDDLSTELEQKQEELHPSATPTPTNSPKPAAVQGPPSNFDGVYQSAGSKFGVPWQVLYGIHITETGGRDGAITSGYGGGAQGPMQFLQQTFNSYATDGNGDGVTDINNAADAIFTAANYLAAHGNITNGLRSYGGDTNAILNYARSRGWTE